MKRSLRLRKETLAELTADDLAAIGGAGSDTCVTYSILPTGCWCTGIYPSLNVPCRTTDCVT